MTKRIKAIILTLALLAVTLPCAAFGADSPVRMAYLQNDIHHLALWVALENKLFEKHGENVSIEGVFRAGPEIMSAFAAKGLDMAYVGEAPATTAVANGAANVVVVAQVNTEGSALVGTSGDSGIKEVKDLAGKTVAVPGHSTVQDFLLKKALAANNVPPGEVNIIVLKPPEMIGALRTGQIDAFIAWEPYPAKAGRLSGARNIATSKDIWSGHPCCALVSDSGFMAANPERVKRIIAAHVEATRMIREDPEAAVKIGVKYTGMDEATIRWAMKTVHYTTDLSIDGEREYVDFLSRLKYIKVSDPDGFVKSFIDPALLRQIQP